MCLNYQVHSKNKLNMFSSSLNIMGLIVHLDKQAHIETTKIYIFKLNMFLSCMNIMGVIVHLDKQAHIETTKNIYLSYIFSIY